MILASGTQHCESFSVAVDGTPTDVDSYTTEVVAGSGAVSVTNPLTGQYNVCFDPEADFEGCATFSITGNIGETIYTEEWSVIYCQEIPILYLWKCGDADCSCCDPIETDPAATYCPPGLSPYRVKSCHPFTIQACQKFCVHNQETGGPTLDNQSVYIYLRRSGDKTMSRILRNEVDLVTETGCATFDMATGLAAGWWQAQVAVEDTLTTDVVRMSNLNRFFVEPCLTALTDTGCITTECEEP